jgi:hypothetical protein
MNESLFDRRNTIEDCMNCFANGLVFDPGSQVCAEAQICPLDSDHAAGHRQQSFRSKLPVSKDINVIALVKGQERYIFLYDDQSRSEALRTLGRYASNSELSFSWYDAAVLSQKIRKSANSSFEQFADYDDRYEVPADLIDEDLF